MSSSQRLRVFAACVAAIVPTGSVLADELADLKAEIAGMRTEYEARVAALEARIADLESASSITEAIAPPPAPSVASVGATNTAFNPAISVILTGNYAHLSEDPESYAIAGFVPAGEEVGPGERGFNVGESEITLSANVDPYFMGSLTAALGAEGDFEIEEAWLRTLALPSGLSLKAGRFFSGIAYLNEVHAHAWDFIDQPLVYQAMFGGQFAQDGVQVKWIAPTDVYLEFGLEAGNGGAFPGTRRNVNDANDITLFAHLGSDIGDDWTWRGGVSYMDVDASERSYDSTDSLGFDVLNTFSGTSRTWIADATFKWTAPADPKRRSLKLQAEYMQRSEEGQLAYDVEGLGLSDSYDSDQSGWYVQAVYQFLPRWRAGLRYDSLDAGTTDIGLVNSGVLSPEDFALLRPAFPERTSVMLDFSLSEFSRLRAQYALDDARDSSTDEQFFLQYILSLGAHGAHRF